MSCEALESIVKSCDNNSGGIEKIWINQQDNIDTATVPTGTWEIDDINLVAGAPDYTPFEIRRNTGSYVEDAAIDLVNGSSYVTATISFISKSNCFFGSQPRLLNLLSSKAYLTS